MNETGKPGIIAFPGTLSETGETALGRAQIRSFLERAISDLPPDLRLPFLMRETEGMSVRDIATDLSLNPITVKTRLFRARRRLRACLERSIGGGFGDVYPFDGARCLAMADRVVGRLSSGPRSPKNSDYGHSRSSRLPVEDPVPPAR